MTQTTAQVIELSTARQAFARQAVVRHPVVHQVAGYPARAAASRTGAAAASAPIRLTRRGRVVLFALTALVVLLISWVGARAVAAPSATTSTVTHTVVTGETLWQIAAEATPAGEDVRSTLREIGEINGLTGTAIYPGQRVEVPVAD